MERTAVHGENAGAGEPPAARCPSSARSIIRSPAPVPANGVTPFTSVQAFEDIGGLAATLGVRYALQASAPRAGWTQGEPAEALMNEGSRL